MKKRGRSARKRPRQVHADVFVPHCHQMAARKVDATFAEHLETSRRGFRMPRRRPRMHSQPSAETKSAALQIDTARGRSCKGPNLWAGQDAQSQNRKGTSGHRSHSLAKLLSCPAPPSPEKSFHGTTDAHPLVALNVKTWLCPGLGYRAAQHAVEPTPAQSMVGQPARGEAS